MCVDRNCFSGERRGSLASLLFYSQWILFVIWKTSFIYAKVLTLEGRNQIGITGAKSLQIKPLITVSFMTKQNDILLELNGAKSTLLLYLGDKCPVDSLQTDPL